MYKPHFNRSGSAILGRKGVRGCTNLSDSPGHQTLQHWSSVFMEQVNFIQDQEANDLRQRHVTDALPGHHVPLLWSRHQHLETNTKDWNESKLRISLDWTAVKQPRSGLLSKSVSKCVSIPQDFTTVHLNKHEAYETQWVN